MPFKKSDLQQEQVAKNRDVDSNPCKLSNEDVKGLMMTAVRFGTWLAFQASHQDEAKKLGDGLWAKNFPEEKVPADIKERLEELVDHDTNKTFYDLIGDALRQEWGMADETHLAAMLLEVMGNHGNAPFFVNAIQEAVRELVPHFNEGAKFFELRMNTSKHLN